MNDLKIQKSNNKSKQVYTQGNNKWLPESKPGSFQTREATVSTTGCEALFLEKAGLDPDLKNIRDFLRCRRAIG